MPILIAAVLAASALAGCSKEAKKMALPETVDGGFKRVQGFGFRAEYSGPGKVTVTLTEMTSSGDAFEAMQRWKPMPGRLAFYKDRYFGVAQSADLDAKALNAFVSALEKKL